MLENVFPYDQGIQQNLLWNDLRTVMLGPYFFEDQEAGNAD